MEEENKNGEEKWLKSEWEETKEKEVVSKEVKEQVQEQLTMSDFFEEFKL